MHHASGGSEEARERDRTLHSPLHIYADEIGLRCSGGLKGGRTIQALQLAMQHGDGRLMDQADQQGLQCVSGESVDHRIHTCKDDWQASWANAFETARAVHSDARGAACCMASQWPAYRVWSMKQQRCQMCVPPCRTAACFSAMHSEV